MRSSIYETAIRVSRALISAALSTPSTSTQNSRALTWTPSLEQTLHRQLNLSQVTPQLVSAVIDPFLLSQHSLALGFFNWATQQPNFAHDSLSYASIIKSLSTSHHFSPIDRIMKQARSQKVVLGSSVYSLIISLYVRNKKIHIARLVLDEVRRLNFDVGADVYNLVLAGLASKGQLVNAEKMLYEMLHRGLCFSTLGFGVFLWKFVMDGELDKVYRMIDDIMKTPHSEVIDGSIMAVLIVHGLCRASRHSDASQALEELRNRGWKPDFVAYRVVAEAYRESGDALAVNSTLKKKRKLGVAPRANKYGEFILSLVSERLIYEAKEISLVLVHGSFPVDEDVLNALIGTVSGMYPDSALEFLDFLLKIGNLPTDLTLTNLSRNLCKNGRSDELLQVYQTLDSKGYFKDMDSYHLMVSSLCLSGKVKEAYAALKEMKKKGLSPNVELYNHIMEACCRDDLIRPAKRLWDEMFSSGCYGNLKTYSFLIGKLSAIGEVDEAHRLFHHMLLKGLEPDFPIYRSLVGGFCQEGKLEEASEVFNHSLKQGGPLAKSVLDNFIMHLLEGGKFTYASEVLRRVSCDISNLESHMRFLQYLAELKEVQIAIQHMEWLKETAPFMLQHVSSKLQVSLSSPTYRSAEVQQLITIIHDKFMI
ncbi:hypothetical protein SAY87_010143 [Trapa incisa]|uniref:Pentatricopeptide repeat-containing protein n=1 Tax=Trapa incisa TaxID=236973 RepID=A0AAN7GE64_9MYRT|nr:hypothetical protein SAY87_010143 [Trapa incisa]